MIIIVISLIFLAAGVGSMLVRLVVALGPKDPPVEPIGASYQPKLRSEREAAQARYQALMSAQAEREALTRARRAAKPRVASSDLGAAYRNRAE